MDDGPFWLLRFEAQSETQSLFPLRPHLLQPERASSVLCRPEVKPDTASGNTESHSPPLAPCAFEGEVSLFKTARSASGPCQASQRHIKTEQKRRDRINEGCAWLALGVSEQTWRGHGLAVDKCCACFLIQCTDSFCMPWCRFVALQALLPGKEKVEKAVMLTQAADYIRQLQVCCAPLLSPLAYLWLSCNKQLGSIGLWPAWSHIQLVMLLVHSRGPAHLARC